MVLTGRPIAVIILDAIYKPSLWTLATITVDVDFRGGGLRGITAAA